MYSVTKSSMEAIIKEMTQLQEEVKKAEKDLELIQNPVEQIIQQVKDDADEKMEKVYEQMNKVQKEVEIEIEPQIKEMTKVTRESRKEKNSLTSGVEEKKKTILTKVRNQLSSIGRVKGELEQIIKKTIQKLLKEQQPQENLNKKNLSEKELENLLKELENLLKELENLLEEELQAEQDLWLKQELVKQWILEITKQLITIDAVQQELTVVKTKTDEIVAESKFQPLTQQKKQELKQEVLEHIKSVLREVINIIKELNEWGDVHKVITGFKDKLKCSQYLKDRAQQIQHRLLQLQQIKERAQSIQLQALQVKKQADHLQQQLKQTQETRKDREVEQQLLQVMQEARDIQQAKKMQQQIKEIQREAKEVEQAAQQKEWDKYYMKIACLAAQRSKDPSTPVS